MWGSCRPTAQSAPRKLEMAVSEASRPEVAIPALRQGPATVEAEPSAPQPVGPGFVSRYALAYLGTCLMLVAPLLITLALKIDSLVGKDRAPSRLALVAGVCALVAMVGNPLLGRVSERTTSRWGMRRPWMVVGLVGGSLGVLVVAVAPNVLVVLVGWCLAQLFFNGLLAAQAAVLPDQVPVLQRGRVSGVLGVCQPVAAASGTFLVQLFSGHQLAMFLVPCAVGAVFILPFVATLDDRLLTAAPTSGWSMRDAFGTFFFAPHRSPDFAWAFASRFLFVSAYAILATYQAIACRTGSAAPRTTYRTRSSLARSPNPPWPAPRRCSAAASPTGRSGERPSSSPRPCCTAPRCSWWPVPAP